MYCIWLEDKGVFKMQEHLTLTQLFWLIVISSIIGGLLKLYQQQLKDVKDLDKYKNVDDVIQKFGTPDSITEFDGYKKYTFKKSTHWTRNRYLVHTFTFKDGKLVQHQKRYK